MCQGESFESALAIESAGPVVMRVFVKGNAGAFFSNREKIVASLAEDLDVPLLPTSWRVWLCRKVVDVLAELLEASLARALQEVERIDANPGSAGGSRARGRGDAAPGSAARACAPRAAGR